MKWLYNLFMRMFRKPAPQLPQGSAGVEPNWYPPTPLMPSVKDMIISAVQELAIEQYKKENELMNDDKLREYYVKTFTALIVELHKNDGYDFVLITQSQTGVPDAVYDTFRNIFYAACEEIGLSGRRTEHCVTLYKKPLQQFLANIDTPRIDIDEKVRALLHTGFYR